MRPPQCLRPHQRPSDRRTWSRRLRQLLSDDTGAGATELVIITPLLLLLLFSVIQFAIAEVAQHAAQTAASQALAAARVEGGTTNNGTTQADAVLSRLGGVLTDPQVSVTRTATTVTVDISGAAPSLIPGMHFTVHGHASGPVEVFTESGGGS